jgi:hypothetical protein
MLLGSIVCQPRIGEYAAYLPVYDGLYPVFQAVAPLIEKIVQFSFGDTEDVRAGDFIPDGGLRRLVRGRQDAEHQDEYQVKQQPEPVTVHIPVVLKKCLHSA